MGVAGELSLCFPGDQCFSAGAAKVPLTIVPWDNSLCGIVPSITGCLTSLDSMN